MLFFFEFRTKRWKYAGKNKKRSNELYHFRLTCVSGRDLLLTRGPSRGHKREEKAYFAHTHATHSAILSYVTHRFKFDRVYVCECSVTNHTRETTVATWVFFVVVFLSEVKYNLLFAMRKQVYALASARTISTVLPAMETKVTIYELRRRKR